MIYSIRFKNSFNNFEENDVIKFRRGNLFVAPYGGGKTSFLKMLFNNFTGDDTTLEINADDIAKKHIFYLSFEHGYPKLITSNVSSEGVIQCEELISKFDFYGFYEKFTNGVFTNSVLIVDGAFSCLMFPQASSVWVHTISKYSWNNKDKGNQYFFADSNGFPYSYYSNQDVYFLPAKVWVSSIFVSRVAPDLSSLYSLNNTKRSKGYIVLIEGISAYHRSYTSNNPTHTLNDIGNRFVETGSTLTSSSDAAKVYVTKTSAEKAIELFKKRSGQHSSISLNIRPSLKARYDWCSSLNFSNATYKIFTVEEFKDFLFSSKELD